MTQSDAEGPAVRGLVAEVDSLDDDQRLQVLRHLARYVPVAVGIAVDAILGVAEPGSTDEA